jgi:hypothetical protein
MQRIYRQIKFIYEEDSGTENALDVTFDPCSFKFYTQFERKLAFCKLEEHHVDDGMFLFFIQI